MSTPNVPIPVNDRIANLRRPDTPRGQQDEFENRATDTWIQWFTQINGQVNAASSVVNDAPFTAQGASIAATDISNGALAAGLYKFTYYLQTTTAAGATSSLTATLDWTYNGQAAAYTSPAITNGAVGSNQSETKPIQIDGATPVRYSTTYASTGVPAMKYTATFVLERVGT